MSANKDRSEFKVKLTQLAEIESVLLLQQSRRLGPRASFSLVVGTVAGIAVLAAISFFIGKLEIVPLVAGVVFALITAVFTYMKSNLPQSYGERLDGYLAAYEPVHHDAFVALQKQVRAVGFYHPLKVGDWVKEERGAVELLMRPGMESSQFLNRKL